MSAKMSISLTNDQDAFTRSLVKRGKYSSMSSVLEEGLELLRRKTEAEIVETEALRELRESRLRGPIIPAIEMESRVDAMIERKRRSLADDLSAPKMLTAGKSGTANVSNFTCT